MGRAVVTGGAGFLGSHLCRNLLDRGWDVTAVDNFITGEPENIADLHARPGFTFIEQDVSEGIDTEGSVDAVLHLASPASPRDYFDHPIETLLVGSRGTHVALELARQHRARFLLASTSEIYGDPLVNPQPETYWGNVNPVGPRSMYDEAKRFAEAITIAYHRSYGLDTKIARIFNTYGPGMRPGDGRVVPNFLTQALRGGPLTIYGDGTQTRSFCFVDDEIRGLVALLESGWTGPMNIGNPNEFTILELADAVSAVLGENLDLHFEPLPPDDPQVRRPDITLARRVLGWEPDVDLRSGLEATLAWLRGKAVESPHRREPPESRSSTSTN